MFSETQQNIAAQYGRPSAPRPYLGIPNSGPHPEHTFQNITPLQIKQARNGVWDHVR